MHLSKRSMFRSSLSLVKIQLPSSSQSLLKVRADFHSSQSARQFHGELSIFQTSRRPFISLLHKSVLKSTVIMRRNLTINSRRSVSVDEVRLRVCIDSQFALCPNDLCRV